MTDPTFTATDCESVAKRLMDDAKLTLLAACIDSGLTAKQYQAIKRACSRVRKDDYASEDMVERILPIMRAIDKQCEKLLESGELLALEGKSASFYSWWLEKKSPTEYGARTRTELTGEDGGPVKVNSMSSKTDAELIELMLKAKGTQGGGE